MEETNLQSFRERRHRVRPAAFLVGFNRLTPYLF